MSTPRLEVDLGRIGHNARTLISRLARRGVAVTGVTKAVLGSPEVARTLVHAGVSRLGDSRIENIERMRRAGVTARLSLIRSPMMSQIDRVVEHADVSFNTELDVVAALSSAARTQGRVHGIVLMVELGDLREGILPRDLEDAVRALMRLPNLTFEGIGTNLACRSGVVPDAANMAELSRLAAAIESGCGAPVGLVSGGASASLDWALGEASLGRVNDLRLGESILLGREPFDHRALPGLHTDAIKVVAEVIESKLKPSRPWGRIARTPFGVPPAAVGRGCLVQTILAIGEQDIDPNGLVPPPGVRILGASSDHLIVASEAVIEVGEQMRFEPDYAALLRASTSPFVASRFHDGAQQGPLSQARRPPGLTIGSASTSAS